MKNNSPAIATEVSTFEERALALTVTADTLPEAVAMLSKLNKANDKITEEKEKVTKPLNEALKAERARWKPIELSLEAGISSLRRKISDYQTQIKKIEEDTKNKIAERVGAGRGKLTLETALKKIESVDEAATSISTDSGSIRFRTDKCFEVTDVTQLPPEYLLPNLTLIRSSMKSGTELPGVRYYTEQTPVNSR